MNVLNLISRFVQLRYFFFYGCFYVIFHKSENFEDTETELWNVEKVFEIWADWHTLTTV